MPKFKLLVLITICMLFNSSAFAKLDLVNGNDMSGLKKYLLNLGGFLGYDLDKNPENPTNKLLDEGLIPSNADVINAALGAIPFDKIYATFLPNGGSYTSYNDNANAALKANTIQSISYGNPLLDMGAIEDPVSQAVYNIVATPSSSYCIDDNSDCKLYDGKIMQNVIGELPSPRAFFDEKHVKTFVSQLNSDNLISPLYYSGESDDSDTSSPLMTKDKNEGLKAKNQLQQAANFIRYVSGAVTPLSLANYTDYSRVYDIATNDKLTEKEKNEAKSTIANYLASLRVYAAQMSVAFSNLYFIFSERLVQTTDSGVATSAALSQINMATWRLRPVDKSKGNNQQKQTWIEKINAASSATVQKEIAILLAEMNYQLYLNRQQQERLLLTNTMLLLQNAKNNQPDSSALSADQTDADTEK